MSLMTVTITMQTPTKPDISTNVIQTKFSTNHKKMLKTDALERLHNDEATGKYLN